MENYYSPELEGCLVLHDTGGFFPLLSPANNEQRFSFPGHKVGFGAIQAA